MPFNYFLRYSTLAVSGSRHKRGMKVIREKTYWPYQKNLSGWVVFSFTVSEPAQRKRRRNGADDAVGALQAVLAVLLSRRIGKTVSDPWLSKNILGVGGIFFQFLPERLNVRSQVLPAVTRTGSPRRPDQSGVGQSG